MQPRQNTKVPAAWVAAAQMERFQPTTESYLALEDETFPISIVPIHSVEPPVRNPGVRELDRDRSVSILNAFRMQIELPALEVDTPPSLEGYRYRVRDGFHRYHLSAAMGFKSLPISVRPYFDINEC